MPISPPAPFDAFPPTGKVTVLATGYDVRTFIPAGSEVTTIGSLDVEQDGLDVSTLPTAVNVGRVRGTAHDADLADITQTVTYVGGSGIAQALQVQSSVGNTGTGAAMDGPGVNVWNMNARLYSSALRYSGAGAVDSQHVSIQGRAERSLPPGGVPAGRTMAEIWSLYLPIVDHTNLPSSITGTLNGYEMDIGANNLDDVMGRQGAQIIVGPATALADGGYPCEVGRLITFSGHDAPNGQVDGFCKFGVWAGAAYSISLFDTRTGARMDTTVAATIGAPSTTISVTNVWGFTSTGALGQPVSASNPANITINGHAYQQVGFTIAPGTTAGTITLTSAVSVADGTAGNAVVPNAHAIWIGTNQDIAFSSEGDERIFVDANGTFNFMGFSGLLMQLGGSGELLARGSVNVQAGIGLYGKTDPGQQVLVYSRSGAGETAAVAAIRQALAAYGIVLDHTTA